MNADRYFDSLREQVMGLIPSDMEVVSVEFEAAVVVIYVRNYDKFADNRDVTKNIVSALKRRVDIRPDPSTLGDTDETEKAVRKLIPKSAGLTDINFIEETGVCYVEAINPAAVTHTDVLDNMKKETGWNVKVMRSPPIPSKTISDVRGYLRYSKDERQSMLKKVARNLLRPVVEGEQWVRVTALGGYRQVGRSASLLTTRNSKILIDCGLDPGSDNTPYFSVPEAMPITDIDAVVITHAHLDHCGTLPALFKYGYKGPVYCTEPTRDLMALLQLDNIKLAYGEAKKNLYKGEDVRNEILHTITLKYGETTDIAPDVKLTFQNAGHILGSAIAHFHIGDGLHNIAFTGDTKFEKTWLFNPANTKFPRLESMVLESTYGGKKDFQPSRKDASDELGEFIQEGCSKGGKILIPVFAVGRSQEVMLVIEELEREGRIPQLPVYLDGMIWEATAIHTAYPEYLNSALKEKIFNKNENPFLSPIFHRVETAAMREEICHSPRPVHRPRDRRYDVRRAGPGVLQGMGGR
ncbi:beta-CASP ribonuclease aCPSF1 [Candidatus Methanomethylophilus sp. 1R26]|uniref:beta-CASP ribonuclease aCPSF1 n=1 Tax=Candidatus Methanomethylophilus sp. 1R26 TaxID=1769296 RepID=UPI000AB24BD1|nr:beta-CASP ribonuclease aCPSF1 [Candidatus Methanomethylophilus sp. 1R26]